MQNPEFKKNILLELTPGRLVMMPVFLGVVFFTVYIFARQSGEAAYAMQVAALIVFCALIGAYGSKMASESLITEFNEKTWDSQRMTSIEPWDMVCGKLFGSTVFVWYGSLICLIFFAAATVFAAKVGELIELWLIILFASICGQAAMLSYILIEFRKNRFLGKLNGSSYSTGAILVILLLAPFTIGALEAKKTIHWYTVDFWPLDMILCSSIFFAIWSVTGFYREMRKELQLENRPWVWLLFIISMMIYGSGFLWNLQRMTGSQMIFAALYLSFFIGIGAFYFIALVEPKNIVDFRWLLDKTRQRRWRECLLKLPAWLVSFVLCAVIGFLVLGMSQGTVYFDAPAWIKKIQTLWPLSCLLFCLRDMGIILFVNINSSKKNRDVVALFYLLIAYFLIPVLLNLLVSRQVLAWFLPVFDAGALHRILPVCIQIAVVFYFVRARWQTVNTRLGQRTV